MNRPSGFRTEVYKKMTNQKKKLPISAMFLTDWDEMRKVYRGPVIYAF
jgi:hypothetical protein